MPSHRRGSILYPSTLGVAGPGADHALLAAILVALAGRFVERTRYTRLHCIAVRTTGIGHVDRERGAGALHRNCRLAVAAALLERCGKCGAHRGIIVSFAVSAAFAHRKCPGGAAFRDEAG